MMNMSIECNVKECKYNNEMEGYCTLNCIHVTKAKSHDKGNLSDCGSFEKRA